MSIMGVIGIAVGAVALSLSMALLVGAMIRQCSDSRDRIGIGR